MNLGSSHSYRLAARSRTLLIQAARGFPTLAAAASYRAFCDSLSRNWKTVWGSPLGCPLGRLVSMPGLCHYKYSLTSPFDGY
jgi:hypothetical protein